MTRPTIEELAVRRYPRNPLAVEMFLYDRQRAGLGALSERKRHGMLIRRMKYVSPEDRSTVVYDMRTHRLAQQYYDLEPITCGPGLFDATAETITVKTSSAAHKAIQLRLPVDFLSDQRSRVLAAKELRRARAKLREALNAT